MYFGFDVHKRNALVVVSNEAGEVVEEIRVENANMVPWGSGNAPYFLHL